MGPLAMALFHIVLVAERFRIRDNESLSIEYFTELYRGVSLPESVINQYRQMKGRKFCLAGFISTSLNLEESIYYACKNTDPTLKSVLMHVYWRKDNGCNAFRMNTEKYSAMPHEKEVLLNDGTVFFIEDVIEDFLVTDKNNKNHSIIKIILRHDSYRANDPEVMEAYEKALNK